MAGRNCSAIAGKPANKFNEVSAPIVNAFGYPVIRTWVDSLARWDDHLGWVYAPETKGLVLDCTHFCLATGVLDHWVFLLAKVL